MKSCRSSSSLRCLRMVAICATRHVIRSAERTSEKIRRSIIFAITGDSPTDSVTVTVSPSKMSYGYVTEIFGKRIDSCPAFNGNHTIVSAFSITISSTVSPLSLKSESRAWSLNGLRTSTVKRSRASYSFGSEGLSLISKL